MAHTATLPETSERRAGERRRNDRRNAIEVGYSGSERRGSVRESDRRKVERRRMIDPTTCERDYSEQEVEFMRAMDDYKRRSGRQFPTWSEVLEVIRDLGYRQTAEPTQSYVDGTESR